MKEIKLANIENIANNQSVINNVKRKTEFIDTVSFVDDYPLFSWIDINPTELCNMLCDFCPRSDPNSYPNQALHMSSFLFEKIGAELKELNYQGAVTLSGYGEPLLHPEIAKIPAMFDKTTKVEIVTNGKTLTPELINQMISNGLDYFVVSMYEGEFQREIFLNMFQEAGIDESSYALRDRWYDADEGYGIKLTNRAGVTNVGNQLEVDPTAQCFYPHYSMTIDWNGDVLLCMQDWNKRVKFGNLYSQSLFEIWSSPKLNKYRNALAQGKRKLSPCNNCNANGRVHVYNHALAFEARKN